MIAVVLASTFVSLVVGIRIGCKYQEQRDSSTVSAMIAYGKTLNRKAAQAPTTRYEYSRN